MPRLLGIDLGTTSFKAVVYDEKGTVLASSRVSPPDEQTLVGGFRVTVWRAEKLWDAMCELIRRAVDSLPDRAVDAVAIAELGLVGYPVDSSGNALYAGVTWIDPAAQPSRAFTGCGLDNGTLFSITGNHLSTIYPPAWITWMAEHELSYTRRMTRWLNVGDYVAYRLCGEMALDYSMASQTTMFDQKSLTLRADLLGSMGLEETLFPVPRQAGTPLGRVRTDAAAATGLSAGMPVVLGGADFVCGAYAAGFLDAGDAAILTGTWENVVVCSDQPQLGTALMECGAICDAHVAPGRWSIRIENLSGDVTEWYRKLISDQRAAGSGDGDMGWQPLIEQAEAADAGSSGVIFIPHVFGSYGPRHDSLARGAFIGLSGTCSRRELTRAVFEGLSFQTRHALEALIVGIGRPPRRVVAMGGGAKNRFWVHRSFTRTYICRCWTSWRRFIRGWQYRGRRVPVLVGRRPHEHDVVRRWPMTMPNVPIPVSQVALVVKDLEKSMREYTETMGWGPWTIYEYKPPRLHDTIVRGAPAEFTWIGAETPVGSTYVELLQPLEGPSVFREFMDQRGEGLHHIGYWAKTMDEAERIKQMFAARGVPLLMSSWIDQVYFYYLDSSPMVIEVWTGDLDSLKASRTYP